MKKLIALLLALVMVVGVLAACNNTQSEDTKPQETEGTSNNQPEDTKATDPVETESETPLRIHWDQGIGVDTRFENPYQNDSLMYATYMIWEKPAAWDNVTKDYELHVASEWGHNEDNTQYWVAFRDDVKWHDGEAVTIEDLLWSVNQAVLNTGNSAGATRFEYVKGYEACVNGQADSLEGVYIQDGKLYFDLTMSQADWSGWNSWILPSHCFEGVPYADVNTQPYWEKPIGCGAYIITEVKFPDYFKMSRFDGYYGAPAGIKNVEVINYSSAGSDAMVAALINNELDMSTRTITVDAGICNTITSQNPDFVSKGMKSFNIRAWCFNLGQRADGKVKADLQKPEVRQAFNLIIDEETIAAIGVGDVTKTVCATFGDEYYNGFDNEPSKDTATAKQMLTDAGFDFTQTIDLAVYYTDQATLDCLELLTQDFAEAGVTISTRVITENAAEELYTLSNFDLLYAQIGAGETASARGYFQYSNSRTYKFITQDTALGESGWDELLARYDAAEAYSDERRAVAQEMQIKGYEECVIIPVYANPTMMVYNAAKLYIPETEFDEYDSCFHFDQWKMLG